MIRTVKKIMMAGAVLAISSAAAQALTAKFDQPNMGFGGGPIVVESTDGKTWSKINSTKLTLPLAIFIGHNSDDYVLKTLVVRQGSKNVLEKHTIDGFGNPSTFSNIVDGSTDNFETIAKMNLRDACNSRLVKQGDIHKDHNLFFKVPLQLSAKFYYDNGNSFIKSAYGHSMVPVVCKGYPEGPKRKRMEITKVEFKAYAQPGGKCPKQSVLTVKVEGTRRGKADFIVYNEDGVFITDTATVNEQNTGDKAVYYRSWTVKNSQTHKYLLALKGHKYSSSWKTVQIKCRTAGGLDRPEKVADPKRPSVEKPDTGGKVTNKRPNRPQIIVRPTKPKRPAVPVVDLTTPQLKCIGGKVSLNNCYCPGSHKRMKIAKNTYRCVKMTTNKVEKRTKPNKRKTHIAVPQKKQQKTGPLQRLLKAKR